MSTDGASLEHPAPGPAAGSRVRGLTVHACKTGTALVSDVSFDLPAGAVTALVGPSGVGKSTVLLALIDVLEPERRRVAGRFELEGREFFSRPPAERRALRGDRVAWIPQAPLEALSPSLRALDQVAEVVRFHRDTSWEAARERAASALRGHGLAVERHRAFPHELSGGERQRVVIAMAMVASPAVLLADEPTTALDGVATHAILRRLSAAARAGMAVLWVTHELPWIRAYADRIVLMEAGRVALEGGRDQVLGSSDPAWLRFSAADSSQ